MGYNDDDVARPLCIKLPQMVDFIKHFEGGSKAMSFKASDNKLLKSTTKYGKKSAV